MKPAAGPIVAWGAVAFVLSAQPAGADTLSLRLDREIGVLVPRQVAPPGARLTPGSAAAAAAAARPQVAADNEPHGALFLIADRLEGTASEFTAEGDVELRTRRETVLADKLRYDVPTQ